MNDDKQSRRPSLVSGELVRAVREKMKENRKFIISSLSM